MKPEFRGYVYRIECLKPGEKTWEIYGRKVAGSKNEARQLLKKDKQYKKLKKEGYKFMVLWENPYYVFV